MAVGLVGAIAWSLRSPIACACVLDRRDGHLTLDLCPWLGQRSQKIYPLSQLKAAQVVNKRASNGHHYWVTEVLVDRGQAIEFAALEPRDQQERSAAAINRILNA